MTRLINKKIASAIGYVIVLAILIISISLLLDEICIQSAPPNHYIDSFHISAARLMSPIAALIGLITWLIIIINWIINGKLQFYLKSIFFAKTMLIGAIIWLLMI